MQEELVCLYHGIEGVVLPESEGHQLHPGINPPNNSQFNVLTTQSCRGRHELTQRIGVASRFLSLDCEEDEGDEYCDDDLGHGAAVDENQDSG